MSKHLKAIYCKYCHSIIYSMSNHDFKSCACSKVSIDAKGMRFGFHDKSDFIELELDKVFLYDNLLELAYSNYGMLNIQLGKFVIKPTSNENFYKQAIVNWEEFEPYFRQVVTKSKLDMFTEAKEKGLVKK